LPVKAALGIALFFRASSLASQLLHGPRTTTDSWPTHNIVGARLAGEGGLGYCIVLSGLFAAMRRPDKPAPTGPRTAKDSWPTHNIAGARLAGEGGLEYCIVLSGLFAGKPAPTGPKTAKDSWPTQNIVGARLGGEGGLGYCIVFSGLFAGKPAPTWSEGSHGFMANTKHCRGPAWRRRRSWVLHCSFGPLRCDAAPRQASSYRSEDNHGFMADT
jgi:hypothetical protein